MATRPQHRQAIIQRERERKLQPLRWSCLFVLITCICRDTDLGFRAACGSITLSLGSCKQEKFNKTLLTPRDMASLHLLQRMNMLSSIICCS